MENQLDELARSSSRRALLQRFTAVAALAAVSGGAVIGADRVRADDDETPEADDNSGKGSSNSGRGSDDDDSADSSNTTVDATQVGGADGAVRIENFTFLPGTLNVAVGTTVTWTNADTDSHTVTEANGVFDSGKLSPGSTYTFTFDAEGSYDYHCELHANMNGSVVVGASSIGTLATPEATAESTVTEVQPAKAMVASTWELTFDAEPSDDFVFEFALLTLHDDGTAQATFVGDFSGADGVPGPAFGAWTSNDSKDVRVQLQSFLTDDELSALGEVSFKAELRLGENGLAKGEFTSSVTDPDGTETASPAGSFTGEQITA